MKNNNPGIREPTYEEDFIVRELEETEFVKYYKITAPNQEQLNMMDKLFCLIEYLGVIGASRNINLFVDGDGAVRLRFQSCNNGEVIFRDLDHEAIKESDCGYGREEINLDSGEDDAIIVDLG